MIDMEFLPAVAIHNRQVTRIKQINSEILIYHQILTTNIKENVWKSVRRINSLEQTKFITWVESAAHPLLYELED